MPIFRVKDENGNTHDIPAIKGEPGDTPIKGVDYLTDEEVDELEERFYRRVEGRLTAENVGARPNTWTPNAEEVGAAPASHAEDNGNPHAVTAEQVGLDKVDNTSDMDKPVSTAQATAIADAKKAGTDAQTAANNAQVAAENARTAADNAKAAADAAQASADNAHTASDAAQTAAENAQSSIDNHIAVRNNPHGVTCAQIGAASQTLLWENDKRTSSFEMKTISLDLSSYDEVLIYSCLEASRYNDYMVASRCPVGETALAHFTWADDGVSLHRLAKTSKTGIVFHNAYHGGSQDNLSMMPYQIYGIKAGNGDTSTGGATGGTGSSGEAVWYTEANVLRFGAVGDGVTDDSIAIQRAFNSGLTVVFPAGKYKFSGINCNHSVDVRFENAEVVPDFYEGTNGVMRKLFTFNECEKVTVKGLRIIAESTTAERKYKYLTESIAEFHNCENVQLVDWTVKNLMYWNRGNTPSELYNRKGILFTAIDSKIEVVDCDFGNIAYEEWNWITYKDNLQGSAATFKNCHFHDSSLGLSCVGIMAHTAKVTNCIFENITYEGSIANLLSLYGNFSDNIILNCKVGGVCDFREGVWVFSTYAKIDNNRMVNSRCDKFAAVSGKDVHITNNVVATRSFTYSHNPLESNILREEGEVTKIRYVIENNVVEALGTEMVDGEIVDAEVNVDNSFMFFRFSNFVEGVWTSSDSEILCRNNRFFSNKKGIKNPNICVIDVGRIILHENVLFLGNRSATAETGYTALQMSKSNVDGPVIDFVGNKIEMNTVNESATKATALQIASGYTTVTMNAFYNSVRSAGLKPSIASGYTEGALQLDAQANVNFI